MLKLYIKESMKKLDDGNILLFDYVGNVVDLLRNKSRAYRIVYNKFDDIYLIARAEDYVHSDMTECALDEGYLPKTEEFMNRCHIDIDELDSSYTDNLVYLTDNDLSKFGSYTDPYATTEFGYEYPIDTGSIFTKSSFGKNYFKNHCKDLYSKLEKFAIDESRVMEDNGWIYN